MSEIIYKQIGEIAMNAKGPMTVDQLAKKLGIINSGRNIYNYIRGAVNYFNKNDMTKISGRIEGVFTNDKGIYIYQ